MEESPTSASEFRDRAERMKSGEYITLSTGMRVKVRRPNASKLIQDGILPGKFIIASINLSTGRATAQDVVDNNRAKRLMASLTLVEPRVAKSSEASDGEITIDMLLEEEIDEIYYYASGGLDNLEKFRQNRDGGTPGPDSETVSGDETERPVRTEDAG